MKLKRFLSVLLALTMCLSAMMISAGAALTVTGNETMETCFPDVNFRAAVISAFSKADGTDFTTGTKPDLTDPNLKGAVLVSALSSFTGTVSAKNKGITNAYGIQYLTSVTKIDLSKNQIADWEFLYSITGNEKEYFG